MTRTQLVGGERVEMTAEEEAAREAEEAEQDRERAAKESQEAALQYRRDRKAAYIAQLGEEAAFQETAGDALDALFKAVVGGDPTEALAMWAKIQAIKARHPKPEGEIGRRRV